MLAHRPSSQKYTKAGVASIVFPSFARVRQRDRTSQAASKIRGERAEGHPVSLIVDLPGPCRSDGLSVFAGDDERQCR
jgi:hypothetical protein